jgi:dephospho-CoA kinase
MPLPLSIGIAGYMGAGKSTAAALFAAQGYSLIDADGEAKRLMHGDAGIRRKLAEGFGPGVLNGTRIDFHALGTAAFASAENLARLNHIVHPLLLDRLSARMSEQGMQRFALDAALLPLWEGLPRLDALVWVRASSAIRRRRVLAKGGLQADEVERRMTLQEQLMPEPESLPWIRVNNETTPGGLADELSRRGLLL